MRATRRGSLVGILTLAIGGAGLVAFDHFEFQSSGRQSELLSQYLAEARCQNADFDLITREDSNQDWRYVVKISGSPDCLKSIKEGLAAKGAVTLPPESAEQGLALPGHTDHERELVVFNFDSEPGAVIWTRDKT